MSGIPGLILAGNHGMEIQGQGLQFVHPGAVAARGILDQADRDLRVELSQIPGALVEHKGLTLTVHYRSVDDSLLGEVDSVIDRLTRGFVESGQLRLTRGKRVVEVRPAVPWDKGRAIQRIWEECGDSPVPVYFGDDLTDEDGFRVVQDLGRHGGVRGPLP